MTRFPADLVPPVGEAAPRTGALPAEHAPRAAAPTAAESARAHPDGRRASRPQPHCALRRPSADEDHGRGLLLVAALADAWGSAPRCGPGKCVWAEFQLGTPQPAAVAR
ncbi:hypothetical protein GCM10018793_01410 [Streptomyces sulfonofaciens]|uniref:ATP-binding protein n=1 Tax=Streptomyces sulfonofaciens TaxID=68272 RepID=A0A919FMW8_9ACTN|nr:hypothetical protein [Streptomyces sulfonofaciens]GHH69247.1 hypothetical protein GCM10018793_01410 [Streptomyces sulfonofaciens]